MIGEDTLFRMILERNLDGGEIQTAKGVKIGYLPQEVIALRGNTVLGEVLKGAPSHFPPGEDGTPEEELSELKDPLEHERIAREYGKLQDGTTPLGYGLEAEAKRIGTGLGFRRVISLGPQTS